MQTTNTTIENNKLIAEFMGDEPTYAIVHTHSIGFNGDFVIERGFLTLEDAEQDAAHYNERFTIECEIKRETKEYHTSWDWLMLVIDKISKYNEANHGAAMEDILPTWAVWSNDIGAMYAAVVDAIKSINEQENTEQ